MIAMCAAALAMGAGSGPGPKVIHADGVAYTACGGVVSIHSPHEYLESDPGTYEVVYQDAEGGKHHLSRVRSLTVTDFVGDGPECEAAAKNLGTAGEKLSRAPTP